MRKITQTLILLSLIATLFDLARFDIWGTTSLLYLIWNLFLAWIPYVIALCFIKKDTTVNIFVPLFILWLLFFSNAPYLVTDVVHLISSMPKLIWYDSLLFFFFGWIGLLLGMLSLFHIHQYLKAHASYWMSEIIIAAICFLSSFGIYLGRFKRWNSWDIFFNPLNLIKDSLNVSSNFIHAGAPFTFVIVFTIFLYAIYKTTYVLLVDKIEF